MQDGNATQNLFYNRRLAAARRSRNDENHLNSSVRELTKSCATLLHPLGCCNTQYIQTIFHHNFESLSYSQTIVITNNLLLSVKVIEARRKLGEISRYIIRRVFGPGPLDSFGETVEETFNNSGPALPCQRSEERRVGKEGRSR